MSKLNRIVRSTVLALALLGFAGGAVAITHVPTFTIADSSHGNLDAG